MTVKHKNQTEEQGIHQIHNWTYPNQVAREGATGFTADDLYKIARQSDNNSLWILTATTPSWTIVGGGDSAGDLKSDGSVPMVADFDLDANALDAETIVTPDPPAAGRWKLYAKTDGWYGVDSVGNEAGPFGGISLSADADNILDLTGQEIGLDDQAANTVFAGPTSGSPDAPDFRALVVDDLPLTVVDAATNTTTPAITVGHNTSGVPVAGLGVEIAARTETDTTENTNIGALSWIWRNITHASRRSAANIFGYLGADKVELANFEAPSSVPTAAGVRGVGSVDLQSSRTDSSYIPSGAFSAIVGGRNNTASGSHSTVIGGLFNIASGIYSAIVGGGSNVASAAYGVAIGSSAVSRLFAQVSHAGPGFTGDGVYGKAQQSTFLMVRDTDDGGTYSLYIDFPATTYYAEMRDNTTWLFEIHLVARRMDSSENAAFIRRGVIKRDANAASTAIVGSVQDSFTENIPAWVVAVSASTPAGGLQINVTGEVAKTIRWVAAVHVTEASYGGL
jgi:hypothetical protein